MRIGIDISQVVYEGTGVAAYTTNLVDNLLRIDRNNDYTLFGSSLRRKEKLIESVNKICINNLNHCRSSIWPLPPIILDTLWNRLHVLLVESLVGNIAVFHSSDWTQPPSKAKKVTTVHDLVAYKYPDWLHHSIVETHRRRLDWVEKESDLIIAVSQATKKDIMEILDIEESRIRVIYEAADDAYRRFVALLKGEQKKRFDVVKRKYSLPEHYFLAVGTQEPRKNLDRLIQAVQILKTKAVNLVIAGKYGWGALPKVSAANTRVLGYIDSEDLPALYWGAGAFIYPSLYEGFGLPIVEAMTMGCPVITSKTSSLPEVGGEAALYVDPLSVEDIAAKMTMVWDMGSFRYKDLVKKCIDQASKFSWEKTARETIDVYEELG